MLQKLKKDKVLVRVKRQGSVSLWLQRQMARVSSAGLSLLLVCTHTCMCVKENVQVALCAQSRPAGGRCCAGMQKAFLCPI